MAATAEHRPRDPGDGPVLLAFFLSGSAGLIHEIAWIRRAALAFGATTYALSTVLAVFFAGLAIGSTAFGHRTRSDTRPLRTFARLELGVALLAILSIPGFEFGEHVYGAAWDSLPAGALVTLRVALVALVLLPPAILMGGTLPVLCAHFVRRRERSARGVGSLYALNTLGAAGGCALAGLVLVPHAGVRATLAVGASLNLLAGALAWRSRGVVRLVEERTAAEPPQRAGIVTLLVFASGFATVGQEVLWSRFLNLVLRVRVTTVTLVLCCVLLGIVLGSVIAARLADGTRHRARVFAGLQALSGIVVLALFTRPPAFWRATGSDLSLLALMLLPGSVLAGMIFPLAVRMVTDEARSIGARAGGMAAASTFGGIVGSLVVGFLVLPHLGLDFGVRITTGVSVAAGVVAWLVLDEGAPRSRAAWISASAVVWILLQFASTVRLPDDYLADRTEIVDVREGLESNLAVLRRDGKLHLEIDRTWQGQDEKNHQLLAAHLPMALHGRARDVLVVGVGVGQTARRFLMHGSLERLVCVDIEPQVFDLIRAHFTGEWLDDARVEVERADGRQHVRYGDELYDVVSLELGQIFRPGVADFYTREFYGRLRERLAPDGIVCQFLPVPFLAVDDFRSAVRTFAEAFPESALWYNTSELLLLGARDELTIDVDRVRRLLEDPAIAADLRYSHWGGDALELADPAILLAGFLAGPRGLAALGGDAPLLVDDRPWLAHSARDGTEPVSSDADIVALLRTHGESVTGDLPDLEPGFAARIDEARSKNLADLAVQPLLRAAEDARAASDFEEVRRLLTEALGSHPNSLWANRTLGDTLLVLGDPARARDAFEVALQLAASDAASHRGMAFALHQSGDAGAALPHYRAALAENPLDAEVHNNLGVALAQGGDLETAVSHFEAALRAQADHADAQRNLVQARAALRESGN